MTRLWMTHAEAAYLSVIISIDWTAQQRQRSQFTLHSHCISPDHHAVTYLGSPDGAGHSGKGCTCPVTVQDTRDEDTWVHNKCRTVCYLQGSAGIYMLQGGQGLRGQHWDCMQLAASQAHVACVQSLPTCLRIIPTRSLWHILLQHPSWSKQVTTQRICTCRMVRPTMR